MWKHDVATSTNMASKTDANDRYVSSDGLAYCCCILMIARVLSSHVVRVQFPEVAELRGPGTGAQGMRTT